MTDDDKVQIAVLRSEVESLKRGVDGKTSKEAHGSLESRVSKMEGNQRWVVLAVIGAVIASLMQQLGISK